MPALFAAQVLAESQKYFLFSRFFKESYCNTRKKELQLLKNEHKLRG